MFGGKTVAITGATGGLGREVCFELAHQNAHIIMLNRNAQKTKDLINEIVKKYPNASVTQITLDLEDMDTVKLATERLIKLKIDVFIANAGAYSIPRHKCTTGFDNVFQINFVSPYYMIIRLKEALKSTKFVAVGSIAHTYSKIDEDDIDFCTCKKASLVYGNAKRFLMLSLTRKFKDEPRRLSIVHPGITFTNITAHYPKLIFAVIKYPMKIIFMKPKTAARCILAGIDNFTPKGYWIGPSIFDIWGGPKCKKIKAAFTEDCEKAIKFADSICF